MPKVFSQQTLRKFEDASASIPLRQIDRAFEGANIRIGEDSGEIGGARRAQFRRYVAGVDQHDPQQLNRLGHALGALIKEVAASKEDFLVKAAERDGFVFADGVFLPTAIAPISFAITRVEDLAFIGDRGSRLHLLANDDPKDAIRGANELVESVCRTILGSSGEHAPAITADIVDVAQSTLRALEPVPANIDEAKHGADLDRRCLQQLGVVAASFADGRNLYGPSHARNGKERGLSPRHARLAVGAAVTFAGFVAETFLERGFAGSFATAAWDRRR